MLDSVIMLADQSKIKFLAILLLLFATLACRAATRMVIPDTPTPSPTLTPTLTPTAPPTLTPTATFEAACPELLEEIVDTAESEEVARVDKSDQSFNEEEETVILVAYQVSEDEIRNPHKLPVSDELKDERDDRARHTAIWNYFAAIIPAEERSMLSDFLIFTDGKERHQAAVGPSHFDPEEWALHIDILDAESYYELTYVLIHEQGHLLTLKPDQVTPSKAIFEHPENEKVYQKERAACSQYFTGEGCSTAHSYINQFYNRFWTDLYSDWEPIELEEDEDARFILIEDFYKTYEDQFLTSYAPSSPAEDIAESWSFFVLSPKPENDSIADEKTLFFYEYPELVELRTQIVERICAEFPQ